MRIKITKTGEIVEDVQLDTIEHCYTRREQNVSGEPTTQSDGTQDTDGYYDAYICDIQEAEVL